MSQLQEELVVLRERLALHDTDRQATTTQLQNQVPGEAGTSRGHCLLWSRSEDIVRVPGAHRSQVVTFFWFGKMLQGEEVQTLRLAPEHLPRQNISPFN